MNNIFSQVKRRIQKGEYIVEYAGNLLSKTSAQDIDSVFLFEFKFKEKQYW